MIEGLSHMTLVVRDLDKTTELYQALFDARVVYDSGDKSTLEERLAAYREADGNI